VRLLLLVLLVAATPAASAWSLSLEAPPVASVDAPFLSRACVEAPAGARVQLKAGLVSESGATTGASQEGQRADARLYGPAFDIGPDGRACRDLRFDVAGGAPGDATLEVRARPERGAAAKAEGAAVVTLLDVPLGVAHATADAWLELADGARLRLPVQDGRALVPLVPRAKGLVVDGAPARELPPPIGWRIAEVRAGATAGVVLENAGPAPGSTGGLALRQGAREWTLPLLDVPPGARVLAAAAPTPDGTLHVPLDVAPRSGLLELRLDGAAIDAVEVPRLKAGESWTRERGVAKTGQPATAPERMRVAGELVAYVTPDAGAAPLLDLLGRAEREVLAELYTLTSEDVAAALADAALRGARVSVLLEGAPAGGVPAQQPRLVAALLAAGADVATLESAPGFPARYRTLHAKTLVVDREWVHVATENPTPSSYPAVAGEGGTRGAGLVLRNATLAAFFARVHEADAAGWPDVRSVDPERLPPPSPLVRRAGAEEGPSLRLSGAWNATPVLSPDSSDALVALVESATTRVDVALLLLEPRFRDGPNPLVEAALDAARRNVTVRVLLDGRMDEGNNAATVRALEAAAAREGLPLEARVAAPDRLLHAKLVLVDGRASYVGSMNGGRASMRDNREAGLIVENATLAQWYGERYDAWWRAAEEGGPAPRRDAPGADQALVWAVLAGAAMGARLRPRRARAPRRRSRR
jgi:phosphatidylserine/phosphatidylglycerophosphate/cardiolipin synthase-like enzyme